MNKSIKTAFALLVMAVVIVLVAFKLLGNKKEVAEKVYRKNPDAAVLVKIDTVALRPLRIQQQYLGAFEASQDFIVSAETQGRVVAGNVREGDIVGRGSLIAQVDNEGLKAQQYAAQASYANARQNLERYQNVSIGEGVSQLQVDEQKLNLKNAESQLQQIDKQIRQSRIYAPASGSITAKYFEVGSYVSPGTRLVEITDISSVKLNISVPENEIAYFTQGKKIAVHTDVFPKETYAGVIEVINAKADASHNYSIKVWVRNNREPRLLAGMYGKVTKEDELNSNTLTIPRAALLGSAKKPQVFVIQNGIARLTDIQTGRSTNDWIEVTQGLSAGDLVAASGQVNLNNGIKVSPAQ